jgi:hypothetical protein
MVGELPIPNLSAAPNTHPHRHPIPSHKPVFPISTKLAEISAKIDYYYRISKNKLLLWNAAGDNLENLAPPRKSREKLLPCTFSNEADADVRTHDLS